MQSDLIHLKRLVAVVLTLACCLGSVLGQSASKSTLAVSSVKASPSLIQAVQRSGKSSEMGRMLEAFDGQLIDRVNATRKFTIVGRTDLIDVIKEQELAGSGNVDVNDKNAARAGKLSGAKYLLVTSVDDWEDSTERIELPTLRKVAIKRKVRVSVVAKIYDSSTAKLLESASIQLTTKDDRTDSIELQKNAELTDELLLLTVKEVADKVAKRVADVIYPIKVVIKRGQQIIINRGDGGDVVLGQLWNVYAAGEALIDPDTGENLGVEELLVGQARIVSITPKNSTAEILEDNGIDRGAVLRLPPVAVAK